MSALEDQPPGDDNDWIDIGGVDQLAVLVERYVGHLGKESLFDLH